MKILERYWSTINRTNIARNMDYHMPNPYPTNILKEECKSKDMITAKFSKTIENLTNKKPRSNITRCSNELKSTYQRATSLGHHVRIII